MIGLLLWFTLSLGVQDYTEAYNTEMYTHAPITVEIDLHAENEWLDIYGIYKNEMNATDTWMYAPQQDYFTVGATISIGNFSFNVSHMCQHPVGNYAQPLVGEYGGYNKIEITFSSK